LKFAAEVVSGKKVKAPQDRGSGARDRGIRPAASASTRPYFILRSLSRRRIRPRMRLADAVTIACRSTKSAHELELMRLACEATFDVFRCTFA